MGSVPQAGKPLARGGDAPAAWQFNPSNDPNMPPAEAREDKDSDLAAAATYNEEQGVEPREEPKEGGAEAGENGNPAP